MSFTHPRRTTKTTSTALTPSLSNASGRVTSVNTNMTSLRKGSTFHSPPSSLDSGLRSHFQVPSLPRRSQSSLDDVVDAHRRRVALTLGDIDRGLIAADDLSPTVRQSFPDIADPVPQSFLDHTVGSSSFDSIMNAHSDESASNGGRQLRPRQNRRPARYADSGLGSSMVTSSDEQCAKSSLVTASAITRSAAHSSSLETLPRLSSRASNRIQEHILKPLLAKASLRDYHPIVRDCPRRINEKEIVCLRDLEKTLIFMAPERTKSAALYLDFCLTSIACIQATVEYLSENEQTRPSDRPYSGGYFVDLVDQIRQYSQQLQAAKEKAEKGEELGDMDPESTDEVKLHGGLTKNGRPAELVRVKKNGKAISIATGLPVDLDEDSKGGIQFKRSLSEEAEDDESILRSMARRKRSASAAELAPKRCREKGCDKEFKRPCDLTKHEKTHSRPWKCPNETCKYHEYGWPTEKEMDRHINDKHSDAPAMYECKYKPCAYRSKRESNCKQHMEKAHGWTYVRSKNNGKNRDGKSVNGGLPTPQTMNMPTPSNSGSVVNTPQEDDFSLESINYDHQPANFSHPADRFTFPSYSTNEDMFGNNQHLTLDYSPISEMQHSTSSNQSPYIVNMDHSPYTGTMDQIHFDETFVQPSGNDFTLPGGDFNLFDNDEDLYSARAQVPATNTQVFQNKYDPQAFNFNSNSAPHISPVGHGNTMLYTPTSMQDDEGFEDFQSKSGTFGDGADFQLFSSGGASNNASNALFGEVNNNFDPSHFDLTSASTQQMLDYVNYSVSTRIATQSNQAVNQNMNYDMDWTSGDQFTGYQPQ